jgi:hypothetical protein
MKKSPTLTLEGQRKVGGGRSLPVTYLDATTAIVRDRSRHRAGRDTAAPARRRAERGPRAVIVRARVKGLKRGRIGHRRVAARRSCALPTGGARAPARGPAAAPSSSEPPRAAAALLVRRRCELIKREEREPTGSCSGWTRSGGATPRHHRRPPPPGAARPELCGA